MKPRHWLVFLSLAAVAAGYSLAWAWDGYFASLHPFDLATAEHTSPEVLDRDGKLLRAFTMPDGRWRLPVSLPDVDPRFVAMLLAYEDHRFYEHHGVDPEALARAAAQFATRRADRFRRLDGDHAGCAPAGAAQGEIGRRQAAADGARAAT